MALEHKIRTGVLKAQRDEITEYHLYLKLAGRVKKESDRKLLEKIADEELAHYKFFLKFSNEEVKPSRLRIFLYYSIARLFGLNFGVRLMERSENLIQSFYGDLRSLSPEVERIISEEQQHEERMLELIDQEELAYTGSVVLGLNDALVELTGVLAGLTLALQDARIVAVAGFITGVAASLSMAASEYLSTKEEGGKSPIRASIYTGIAYVCAVVFLIVPYFLFTNPFVSLAMAVSMALIIVFIFTFYISVAKNLSFKRRFMEMAAISLGVAILNFFIGLLVRKYLHIDV